MLRVEKLWQCVIEKSHMELYIVRHINRNDTVRGVHANGFVWDFATSVPYFRQAIEAIKTMHLIVGEKSRELSQRTSIRNSKFQNKTAMQQGNLHCFVHYFTVTKE